MQRWIRYSIVVLVAMTVGLGTASAAAPPQPPSPNDQALSGTQAPPTLALIAPSKMQDLYTPITPCRIVDTRKAGGAIGAETRTYYVAGTFGFAPAGGTSGGCGIPTGAVAVAATVTAVSPSNSGFMRTWPANGVEPQATMLNYATFSTGTGTTLTMTNDPATKDLALRNYGGPTHLVIDVTGYYLPQIHAVLAPSGGVYDGSPRVLTSDNLGTGSYRVLLDIDPAGCTPIASVNGSSYFASSYVSGGYIYANTYDPSGTLTNLYWDLTVVC